MLIGKNAAANKDGNWEKAEQCLICQDKFGLFTRRHKCKRCSRAVCDNCSPKKGKIYIKGQKPEMHRTCKICNEEKVFLEDLKSKQGLGFNQLSKIGKEWIQIASIKTLQQANMSKSYQGYLAFYKNNIGIFQSEIDQINKDVEEGRTSQDVFNYSLKEFLLMCTENVEDNAYNQALKNVLIALIIKYPQCGYTQGQNYLVAYLLCFLDEEHTFWIMCFFMEKILGLEFYEKSDKGRGLIGFQKEKFIIEVLIKEKYNLTSFEINCLSEFWNNNAELMLIPLFINFTIAQVSFQITELLLRNKTINCLEEICIAILKINIDEIKNIKQYSQSGDMLKEILKKTTPELLGHIMRSAIIEVKAQRREQLEQQFLKTQEQFWNSKEQLVSHRLTKITHFSKEEILQLRELYDMLITESNGQFTKQSFKTLMQKIQDYEDQGQYAFVKFEDEQIHALYDLFDDNKNGSLDFRETLLLLSMLYRGELEEKAAACFTVYDQDNSQTLDLAEKTALMEAFINLLKLGFNTFKYPVEEQEYQDFNTRLSASLNPRIGKITLIDFTESLNKDPLTRKYMEIDKSFRKNNKFGNVFQAIHNTRSASFVNSQGPNQEEEEEDYPAVRQKSLAIRNSKNFKQIRETIAESLEKETFQQENFATNTTENIEDFQRQPSQSFQTHVNEAMKKLSKKTLEKKQKLGNLNQFLLNNFQQIQQNNNTDATLNSQDSTKDNTIHNLINTDILKMVMQTQQKKDKDNIKALEEFEELLMQFKDYDSNEDDDDEEEEESEQTNDKNKIIKNQLESNISKNLSNVLKILSIQKSSVQGRVVEEFYIQNSPDFQLISNSNDFSSFQRFINILDFKTNLVKGKELEDDIYFQNQPTYYFYSEDLFMVSSTDYIQNTPVNLAKGRELESDIYMLGNSNFEISISENLDNFQQLKWLSLDQKLVKGRELESDIYVSLQPQFDQFTSQLSFQLIDNSTIPTRKLAKGKEIQNDIYSQNQLTFDILQDNITLSFHADLLIMPTKLVKGQELQIDLYSITKPSFQQITLNDLFEFQLLKNQINLEFRLIGGKDRINDLQEISKPQFEVISQENTYNCSQLQSFNLNSILVQGRQLDYELYISQQPTFNYSGDQFNFSLGGANSISSIKLTKGKQVDIEIHNSIQPHFQTISELNLFDFQQLIILDLNQRLSKGRDLQRDLYFQAQIAFHFPPSQFMLALINDTLIKPAKLSKGKVLDIDQYNQNQPSLIAYSQYNQGEFQILNKISNIVYKLPKGRDIENQLYQISLPNSQIIITQETQNCLQLSSFEFTKKLIKGRQVQLEFYLQNQTNFEFNLNNFSQVQQLNSNITNYRLAKGRELEIDLYLLSQPNFTLMNSQTTSYDLQQQLNNFNLKIKLVKGKEIEKDIYFQKQPGFSFPANYFIIPQYNNKSASDNQQTKLTKGKELQTNLYTQNQPQFKFTTPNDQLSLLSSLCNSDSKLIKGRNFDSDLYPVIQTPKNWNKLLINEIEQSLNQFMEALYSLNSTQTTVKLEKGKNIDLLNEIGTVPKTENIQTNLDFLIDAVNGKGFVPISREFFEDGRIIADFYILSDLPFNNVNSNLITSSNLLVGLDIPQQIQQVSLVSVPPRENNLQELISPQKEIHSVEHYSNLNYSYQEKSLEAQVEIEQQWDTTLGDVQTHEAQQEDLEKQSFLRSTEVKTQENSYSTRAISASFIHPKHSVQQRLKGLNQQQEEGIKEDNPDTCKCLLI